MAQITYTEVFLRLFLAGLLGGFIGMERERQSHPAGLRTHILVSLGSALIMMVSSLALRTPDGTTLGDPGRIAAQVVSGIGFLGAGTIMRQGNTIRGLTTAASLWVVAGIGLASGAGFYFGAVATTLVVWLTLSVLIRMEFLQNGSAKRKKRMTIRAKDRIGLIGEIGSITGRLGVNIQRIELKEDTDVDDPEAHVIINLELGLPQEVKQEELVAHFRQVSGVVSISSS
ncbi:MAG: MgtC/SapB family protein [Bacillota bacterium]